MNKRLLKTIIKELATAPETVARDILESLETETEKDEARRIFKAVGIEPKPPRQHSKPPKN